MVNKHLLCMAEKGRKGKKWCREGGGQLTKSGYHGGSRWEKQNKNWQIVNNSSSMIVFGDWKLKPITLTRLTVFINMTLPLYCYQPDFTIPGNSSLGK